MRRAPASSVGTPSHPADAKHLQDTVLRERYAVRL